MNNKLLLVLFVFAFMACKDRVEYPLPASFDYCSLQTESKDRPSSFEVDSLILPGKTGVFVLEEGADAITSRANLCQIATKTMDIQYFIFSEDNIGTISCDYMLKAACKGIKVRVVVDDLMVDVNPDWILALNQHENISIKIYNPNINVGKNIVSSIYSTAKDFRGINQRMHHKTFIIDNQIAITGGRNIADEYFDFDHEYNFRDRDVLLIGGVTSQIQKAFDEYWESPYSIDVSELISYSTKTYDPSVVYDYIFNYSNDSLNFWPKIRAYIPFSLNTLTQSSDFYYLDSVAFVSDPPGKNDGTQGLEGSGKSTKALIQLVEGAKNEIFVQSPYLVVSDLGYNLFADAVKRGVSVHILTNSLSSTDNLEAFSGYQRNRSRLLNAGINLYEYRPDAKIRMDLMTGDLQKKLNFTPIFGLHAKSMVVDNNISVVGTFNLDPRSANLNTECITILHSTEINKSMKEIMKREQLPENAWHVQKGDNPDVHAGRWKRFKTWTRKLIPQSIL